MKHQLDVMITLVSNLNLNVYTQNVMNNKNVVQMVHVSKLTKDVVLLLHVLVNNFINATITPAEKIQRIAHQLKNVLQFHHSSVLMVPVFHIEFSVDLLINVQIKNQLDALISYAINHLLSVKQLKDVQKDLLNVKMAHVCMIYHIVK